MMEANNLRGKTIPARATHILTALCGNGLFDDLSVGLQKAVQKRIGKMIKTEISSPVNICPSTAEITVRIILPGMSEEDAEYKKEGKKK